MIELVYLQAIRFFKLEVFVKLFLCIPWTDLTFFQQNIFNCKKSVSRNFISLSVYDEGRDFQNYARLVFSRKLWFLPRSEIWISSRWSKSHVKRGFSWTMKYKINIFNAYPSAEKKHNEIRHIDGGHEKWNTT